MNYIFAPFAFLLMASVVSREPGDWIWGPIALLTGVLPFLSIVILLISLKVHFNELKKEIRLRRPLSIV
jgi:hypothetical protein